MSQSYTSVFIHFVTHTADNVRIPPEVEERLHSYTAGIINSDIGTPIAVGGMDDHIHALFALKSDMSLSKAAQLIKGNTSRWLNETFAWRIPFRWQQGYGGFGVSLTNLARAKQYVLRQKEHHKQMTAMEEWQRFVAEHEKFFAGL